MNYFISAVILVGGYLFTTGMSPFLYWLSRTEGVPVTLSASLIYFPFAVIAGGSL